MNNPLARPTEIPLDPAYATKDRKEARRFWGTLVLAIIAIIGTTYAVVVNVNQGNDITKVTQKVNSSCAQLAEHPVTVSEKVRAECEHTRQAIAKRESLVGPCILHQRATGTKGANCNKVYVPLNGSALSGGDASQPGSTGSQPPSPSSGGHTGGAVTPHGTGVKDEPGSNSPHQPSNGTEESPPSQASSPETHEEPSHSASPEATPAAPKAPIKEAVGGTVETATGILCTTADRLAGICH